MYNWEIFQAAYRASSPELKVVIDSELIPNCVANTVISQHLDASHHRPMVRLQALFAMRAITGEAVLQEFLRLGIPNGRQVFDALQSCYSKSISTSPNVSVAQTPVPVPPPTATVPIPPPTAIPTPPSPSVVPQIRTMAQDMDQARTQASGEHVYTSTQEALLREGWSTPTKDKQQPDQPSWG